jgi:hypothetical protein
MSDFRNTQSIYRRQAGFACQFSSSNHTEAVAGDILGKPNSAMSRPPEDVRFGQHGSVSLNARLRRRRKGDRCERELVERHQALGVHAERYPLSAATRFRGSGHDLDIYALGRDEAPLVAEVKARKGGGGFVQLEKWLGDFDLLVLRRNNADPLVLLPWRVWAALVTKIPRRGAS